MKRFAFFFFVQWVCVLLAVAESPFIRDCSGFSSLANTSGMVSTIIDGSVSAITGDFIDSQVDIILPGPEPLILQRSYSSGDDSQDFFCRSWHFNHPYGFAVHGSGESRNKDYRAHLGESSGGMVTYKGSTKASKGSVLLKPSKLKGMTNCGNGEISAKTNLKNNDMHLYFPDFRCKVWSGSGGMRSFIEVSDGHLNLEFEKKPNGNRIFYKYRPDRYIESIRAANDYGDVTYSSINFILPNNLKDFRKDPYMRLEASDQSKVTYRFSKHRFDIRKKEHITKYYLSDVERTDKPWEKYEYEVKDKDNYLMRVCSKKRPEGRFLSAEYYAVGANNVGDMQMVHITKKEDFRNGRVRVLKAPVGPDATPVITHRFIYHAKIKEEKWELPEVLDGATEVYNAHMHRTVYFYSPEHRLTGLQKFIGNYQPYSMEKFVWGAIGSQNEGNLIAKYLEDGSGNIHSGQVLAYDSRGNVLTNTFYGKITGTDCSSISLNSDGLPANNGSECYQRRYAYSDDALNLLLAESEDSGKGSLYAYKHNTDLVSTRLITEHGVIKARNYFEYDGYGNLIVKITDDGVAVDKDDLTGVTERHIFFTFVKENPPAMGLPELQGEWVLNSETGKQCLLKNIRSTYSKEGRLIKQEHYDSDDTYCYALDWVYDAHGNVISETNALGETISRQYDANDNMIFEQGPRQDWYKRYIYDYSNRLVRIEEVHANGEVFVTSHRYDYLGNKIATVDCFGNEISYVYDEMGRVVKTIGVPVRDDQGMIIRPVTTSEYDISGNVTAATDPRGHTKKMTYNSIGKPLSVSYPDGTTEQFEYRTDGVLTKSIGKNGMVTTYVHDAFGRLLEKREYSSHGELLGRIGSSYVGSHLISSTDAGGYTTYYTYDRAGRKSSAVKENNKVTYEYDTLGRLHKVREYIGPNEADFIVKVNQYDLLNRVIEERVENGTGRVLQKTRMRYDVDGNQTELIKETEEGLAITRTEYNARKQPVSVTDPLGNTTHYTYDFHYRNPDGLTVLQTSVVDPLGSQTITTMDTLGRVASVIRKNPFGVTISQKEMFYDLNGNRTKTIDTVMTPGQSDRQIITAWEYDRMNQVISVTEAAGTPEQKQTRAWYNSYGQKERITKPDGVELLHGYDAKGRLVSFQASDGTFSYSYEYNENDSPTKILDLNDHTTTLRRYDSFERITSETLGNGLTLSYSYDNVGRVNCIRLPDDSEIRRGYDAIFLKTIERATSSGEVIYAHHYNRFDLSGNLLESQLVGDAGKIDYQYDLLGRVKNMSSPLVTQRVPARGYDAVGNLLKVDMHYGEKEVHSEFTYDDYYQLKSEEGVASHTYICDSNNNRVKKNGDFYALNALNQLLDESDFRYEYDDNGNLTRKTSDRQVIDYTYDALNRLTAISDGASRFEYFYDSFNRRLAKSQLQKENGVWSEIERWKFLYQDQNEVGKADRLGQIIELRLLGLGKGAEIGAAVAIEQNGNLFIPIHDYIGNVIALSDPSGNLVECYQYTAYGEEQIFGNQGEKKEPADTLIPWRFSSKRVDPETGLVYFGRRYYDPRIGRWLAPDPIGFAAGPNLYAYVMNSPLTHFDLYGLMAEMSNDEFFMPSSRTDFPAAFDITRRSIGSSMIFMNRHLSVSPNIIRRNVEKVGQWIKDGNFSYNREYYDTGMDWVESGSSGASNKRCAIFLSGMMCTLPQCREYVSNLSQSIGDKEIYGIHTPTRGFSKDLLPAVVRTIIDFPISKTEIDFCRSKIEKTMSKMDPTEPLLLIPHSRGSQLINQTMDTLSAELRDRIYINSFGSPNVIPPGKAHYVWNYYSHKDALSCLTNLSSCNNVTILKSEDPVILEHGFDCSTYQRKVKEILDDFYEGTGVYIK